MFFRQNGHQSSQLVYLIESLEINLFEKYGMMLKFNLNHAKLLLNSFKRARFESQLVEIAIDI